VQIGIHDVSYSYPDGTCALDRVNLAIHSAECVALIGQNGSGKTTLAKCIAGLMRPSAGSVAISSRNGSAGSARPPTIGYLFQNPDHQIVTDRVDREVAIGLFHLPASTREHRVRQALARVNLSHLALRDPCTLSRGERQRLAVASVLALDPEIIIFDEPTTGQDPDNLDAILRELELFRNQGRTILVVTHDHELAQAFADRIIRMEAGRISQDSILRSLGNIST
jgi:energy-coupling factor transport system ATP-binding protein